VRAAAASALAVVPPQLRVSVLAPLLDDPVTGVRTEAARALVDVPRDALPAERRESFDAALRTLMAALRADGDLPGGQLNLAVLYNRQGRPEAAIGAYRRALTWDADFLPARFNLANLLHAQGRSDEAEALLREGVERTGGLGPEYARDLGELSYSLALLLSERGQLAEAAPELERASELLPERARVHYNRGLVLQRLGELPRAEAALLAARRLAPDQKDFVYALAIFYLEQAEFPRARHFAEELDALSPGEGRPLLNEIDAREAG
jgi:tetratricopeptide (TPR) repeat protein